MQIKVPDAILSDLAHHILEISCTQSDRGDFTRRFDQGVLSDYFENKIPQLDQQPLRPVWTNIKQSKQKKRKEEEEALVCLLYTSPSPRDAHRSRMPSSA